MIAEALRRLAATPDDCVMVGDRRHDARGARDNGLACIGAGWGYARPGELVRAGAAAVRATVADLATTVAR